MGRMWDGEEGMHKGRKERPCPKGVVACVPGLNVLEWLSFGLCVVSDE